MINKEKYPHLYQYEKIILQLLKRIHKEEIHRISKAKLTKIVNTIEINDNIYKDTIKLILDESGLTLLELMEDINKNVKYYSAIQHYIMFNNFSTTRANFVVDENDVIKYVKNNVDNLSLFYDLVNKLLTWDETIRGFEFYHNLHNKLQNHSQVYNLMYEIIYDF